MARVAPPRPNQALAQALTRAGMSPRDLARETNRQLEATGHRMRIHATGAYPWLNSGAVPASPAVRRAVALVLTRSCGTTYQPRQLWPTASEPDHARTRALDDLTGRVSLPALLELTSSWAALDAADHAAVEPATATELITGAIDATIPSDPLSRRRRTGPDHVLPPMATHIETSLAELRRLDDTTGGSAISQRWVKNTLASVIDLLRHARYSHDTGQRLLRAAAGLAQLAGWTAFDANQLGAAQRHHLLGLRLARACDDTDVLANNLGMLAYQASSAGRPAAAVRLATAAVDAVSRARPVVRARALGRLATAQAAAGDLHAHRAAADACRTLLATSRPGDIPDDLYYLTPRQLDAETGHALVMLAITYPAHAKRLLAEATDLLTPLALTTTDDGYRRSALLHSVHLAHAHLLAHDRHAAAHTLHALADRLPGVHSLRCRAMLRDLRTTAARRLPADTRQALDQALSGI